MFPRFRAKTLVLFLLVIVASSATAQPPSLSSPPKNSTNDGTSKRTNQAREIDSEIASLPEKGIVAIKVTNSLGGVVINEERGLALVLSSSPLVLVTSPTLLNFDGEKLDTLESDLERTLLIQSYIHSYGGMGGYPGSGGSGMGMGMGGGYGEGGFGGMSGSGGYGMGMGGPGDRNWVISTTSFSVNTNDKHSGKLGGVAIYEISNLLFIFDGTSESSYGSSAPPATSFPRTRVQLATDLSISNDWSAFTWERSPWEQRKFPSRVANDKLANLKNAAAISPEGQVAFFNDGRTYGRTEIMSAYLQAYQQFKKDSKAQSQVPSSTSDPFADQQPLGSPFTDPAANNSPSSNQTTADDYNQSIVGAVVAVKTASDAAARETALKALTDILGIEFDAHRSLKASEIQSLRQRLEEIEKAEAKKVENRTEILNERIRKLLGAQSVEDGKPQQ